MSIIQVKNLSVSLRAGNGKKILDAVSFDVAPGRVVGVAGGSGSGKTTLGLALLGLVPEAMQVTSGDIIVENKSINAMSPEELRAMRGGRMGMVFQEPMSAFDPVYTVGQQIAETLEAHGVASGAAARRKTEELLRLCGVPDPVRVAGSYPHELSGGLRQRAMIAQAVSCGPKILVADEPTSSLDVTMQAHILALFRRLRRELGLTVIFISHDLGVLRSMADEVLVLCEGRLVERLDAGMLLSAAKHPYTKALLEADV